MNLFQSLELLFNRIVKVHEVLDRATIPHAFGGAIANAYHGRPRATTDIDINIFLVEHESEQVLRALLELGVAVEFDRDAKLIRRDGQIRLRWPPTVVDLFFMTFEFLEAASQRIVTVPLTAGISIPILSAEDLIICKVAFNRGKDWLDLEAIVQVQTGRLDRVYLDHWLAGAMNDDERVQRFNALAEQYRAWEPRSA